MFSDGVGRMSMDVAESVMVDMGRGVSRPRACQVGGCMQGVGDLCASAQIRFSGISQIKQSWIRTGQDWQE